MRRTLVFGLVVALMVIAGTASAGTYASLRMTGQANYVPYNTLEYYLSDTGTFGAKEVAIGFGDDLQGEVSLGYNSITLKPEDNGERDDDEITASMLTLGLAGFYPIYQTPNVRLDLGARFQYMSWKLEGPYMYRADYEATFSGWALGAVARHQWMLTDAIAIGPEIYLKYLSLTAEEDYTVGADQSTDISGFGIDYSLRFDFMF